MRLEEKGSIKTALKHAAGLKVRGAAPRRLLLPIFFYLVYPVTERSMLLACTDLSSNSEVDIERRRNRHAFEKVAAHYRIYCKMIDRFFKQHLEYSFLWCCSFAAQPSLYTWSAHRWTCYLTRWTVVAVFLNYCREFRNLLWSPLEPFPEPLTCSWMSMTDWQHMFKV